MQTVTHRGFTLLELIITLLIVAILALLAYPGYTRHQLRGHRGEGYVALNEIMQAEERFAAERGRYTLDLSQLGYSDPWTTRSGFYAITAGDCREQPGPHCVRLTAKALGRQGEDRNGNDGDLSLNSRGAKRGW